MPHKPVVLEMKNISKEFPGVKALQDVSLELREGEVHVLLGENGAGKSTLMKILSGTYKADSGHIFMDGKEIHITNPNTAQKHGISMIYQELMLAENVMVFQNIMMGHEIVKDKLLFRVDEARMKKESDEVLNGILKAGIDVTVKAEKLSVAQKQLVEIARSIIRGVKVIIMDEPTSSLSNKDIEVLFSTINSLKEDLVPNSVELRKS